MIKWPQVEVKYFQIQMCFAKIDNLEKILI